MLAGGLTAQHNAAIASPCRALPTCFAEPRLMPAARFSRRRWMQTSSVALGAVGTMGSCRLLDLLAAETRPATYAPLNGYPRMLQDYYIREVAAAQRQALERQANLKTKADAESYVQEVRQKIQDCFGPWPERTPLKPRITGTLEREDYRIEKIIFESRPQFFVTANLYVPKAAKFPAPGVVGVCGHSNNGKAWNHYQSFSQGLAKQGYVVLIFDPIGQGERLQLPDENLKPRIGFGSAEHTMLGNQQLLVGEFFGTWEAWDGIRALDYLLTRPEVDARHIGVTGSSGGGTMTTWLAGVDRRFTMAAPSSFLTTFRRNLENELSSDPEQCPPGCLASGLEEADFLAAMAPGPVVLLPQELDNFDVRGTIQAFAWLKRLYTLLGHPDNVTMHIGPGPHGYDRDAREAMYGCFNRATGRGTSSTEPQLKLEDDQTLWCTQTGQVVELKSRPVYAFTREKAEELAATRSILDGPALKKDVASLLQLPARNGPPDYRILRPRKGRDYPLPFASIYNIETEPGILAIVYRLSQEIHHARPPKQTNPAILYVAHDSSDAELHSEPLVRATLDSEPQATLYTCDVRGLGESRPNTCGENSYRSRYGCDYFYAAHALMLARPYVGRRAHDILCVLDWIGSFGHSGIHLVAKGYGAVPAAFAALLHDTVARVTLKHAMTSYTEVASAEIYQWPPSSFVPGVLERFDLTDVYRELAAKQLKLIAPRGAEGPNTTGAA
jgi:dienelactone hydrolase